MVKVFLELSKCFLDVIVGKTKKEFCKTIYTHEYRKPCREIKIFWPRHACFFTIGAIFATRPRSQEYTGKQNSHDPHTTLVQAKNGLAMANLSVSGLEELHCVDTHTRRWKTHAAKSKYFDRLVCFFKIGAVLQLGAVLKYTAEKNSHDSCMSHKSAGRLAVYSHWPVYSNTTRSPCMYY